MKTWRLLFSSQALQSIFILLKIREKNMPFYERESSSRRGYHIYSSSSLTFCY